MSDLPFAPPHPDWTWDSAIDFLSRRGPYPKEALEEIRTNWEDVAKSEILFSFYEIAQKTGWRIEAVAGSLRQMLNAYGRDT